MAISLSKSLNNSVVSAINDKYEAFKLNNTEFAQVFESFFSKNPHKDRQPFQEVFMKLCVILLSFRNHPDRRDGALQKAEFLKAILEAGGLSVEIDKHELEQNDVIYNITATSGENREEPHGLMAFHHDTIKQDDSFIEAQIVDGKLIHPWMLDDTIHVVAGVLEVIQFANNPNRIGNVTIIITDREEMNTLGMRLYLEKKQSQNKLHPYSWIITGESTGTTTGESMDTPELSELIVAVANRGKGVREVVTQIPSEITTSQATRTLISKIRRAQMHTYSKSIELQDGSLLDSEQLVPTAIIPTVVMVDKNQAYAYLEFRTDENMNAKKTAEVISDIFSSNDPTIVQEDQYTIHNFDFGHISVESDDSSDSTILLTCGVNQHPGKYDPRTRRDAFSAIEYILESLDNEICDQIEEVIIGEKAKPNSMSNKAVIRLKKTADRNAFLEILKSIPTSPSQKTNPASDSSWTITRPNHIPDRETIRMSKNNRHIVEKVQETIAENMSHVFGKTILSNEILTGVFNAMHDGGAITVKKEWYDAIFSQGNVNMIVLGSGNFNLLHNPQEPMSYNTLNLVLCQYHNLINKLNSVPNI